MSFDRFRQADSSLTRSYGGLGLGLAIVRHLVELHGGSVWADSAGEGQGATFTVELPIGASAVSHGASHAQAAVPPRLDGLRVLIVDDQPDERELFSTVLARYGVAVTVAGSAHDALAAIKTAKPDVLVSDIAMPDQDGYTLIRQIRALAEEQGGSIPAVAVTAHARLEDRERALAAGFQFYVAKPIVPSKLIEVVAVAAGRRSAPDRRRDADLPLAHD